MNKKNAFKHLLLGIVLSCTFCSNALSQRAEEYYSLKMYNKEFHVEGKSYEGASTALLHPYKNVRKAWWRYIKSKAYLTNHISHYVLKVPSKSAEEEPTYLINTIHQSDNQTIIRIAYRDADDVDNESLKNLLREFKTQYFSTLLETQIIKQEKVSKKLGNEMDSYQTSRKIASLDSIEIKKQINAFEYQIHQSDLRLDSLKSLLGKIK
ncbi:hypothetical protein [Reichenbachiella versicolor]|uniref:hypothetical protein n=1 Tax=Reichenbachiella versicolor TaxID=1821036 RepID=UPI000D6DD768|nr:hypothetical protein [Reichenbachiella versicolor]